MNTAQLPQNTYLPGIMLSKLAYFLQIYLQDYWQTMQVEQSSYVVIKPFKS